MSGEKQLAILLQNMTPILVEGTYVFCTQATELEPLSLPEVIGCFHEAEGISYILPQPTADRLGLTYEGTMAWITLNVHSSLLAIGLTAAVSGALARAGISCNVVAANYHDHLFIPKEDVSKALITLQQLSNH